MRVAGFGFRKGAGVESLLAALDAAGGEEGLDRLATVDGKADEAGFQVLSSMLGLPVEAVSVEELADAEVITVSEASFATWGTGSVAEASALVAAGTGASLQAPRCVSQDGRATCAIAVSDEG